jgi:tRNA A37 threonylcarbamoyladenosine modification protein TsaB
MLPLAKAKLQVNDTVSAEHVEPVYIRDKVAKSLAERKAQ